MVLPPDVPVLDAQGEECLPRMDGLLEGQRPVPQERHRVMARPLLPRVRVGAGGSSAIDTQRKETMTQDFLPYGDKGSGWSGSETSRERQEREDSLGITGKRQAEVFALLAQQTTKGMTVKEVEDALNIGHGPASSALTHLHRAERVVRLQERRLNQQVYLLRGYAEGRPESPYRPRLAKPHPKYLTKDQVLAVMGDAGVAEELYPDVRRLLEALP